VAREILMVGVNVTSRLPPVTDGTVVKSES
jgi:hypothetical protein